MNKRVRYINPNLFRPPIMEERIYKFLLLESLEKDKKQKERKIKEQLERNGINDINKRKSFSLKYAVQPSKVI